MHSLNIFMLVISGVKVHVSDRNLDNGQVL